MESVVGDNTSEKSLGSANMSPEESPAKGSSAEVTSAERPSAERPSTERPSAEKPSAERPSAERPSTEKSSAERPSAERPSAERTSTERPSAERPSAERPSAEKLSADRISAERPSAEGPSAERPSKERPSAERTSVERSSAERTSAERPSAERPSAEKPSVERSSKERPSAERPSAVRPSAVRPSAVRPSAVRPSKERPSAVRPSKERPSAERTFAEEISAEEISAEEISAEEISAEESLSTREDSESVRRSRKTEARKISSGVTSSKISASMAKSLSKKVSKLGSFDLSETVRSLRSTTARKSIERPSGSLVNYSYLESESLVESISVPKIRRIESIIEKYRDNRKRAVSLESLESAASIPLESLETQRLTSIRGTKKREDLDEEEVEAEEEDEDVICLKDPSFLDEFDQLEDIVDEEEEDRTGVGATEAAFQEFGERVVKKEIKEKVEDQWSYDSEDEVLSESDEEAFFYGRETIEKDKASISLEEETEIKIDKYEKETEKEKKSIISFGPRELEESFLSTEHLTAEDMKARGSEYEFKFKFRWNKRRMVENLEDDYKKMQQDDSAYNLLQKISMKIQKFKDNMKDTDSKGESLIEKSHEDMIKEPCYTRTESYIRNDIAPILVDIAFYLTKEKLDKAEYFKYASYVFKGKRTWFEPNLFELEEIFDKVQAFIEDRKRGKTFAQSKSRLGMSEFISMIANLKLCYEYKKRRDDAARKRDAMTVVYWVRNFQKPSNLISKLTNYDILYNPIPKRKLPKQNQIIINRLIRQEKESALMKLKEKADLLRKSKGPT